MCGYGEIDGHTFCLGLDHLGINIEPSTSMVTTLIRGATFRPKKQASDQGRLHLDIGPLGELVDAYHAHKATERHDKIFALLGMSSDAIGVGDLRPDYQTPWETLLRRLVMFLLGNQVSISTWESKEIAICPWKRLRSRAHRFRPTPERSRSNHCPLQVKNQRIESSKIA
jgi:hypothetical protein